MHLIHLLLQAIHDRLGDLGWDVTKDAIKFLLGAAAGWGLKIVRDRWRTRHARAFWRPFLSSAVPLIVGRFGEELDEFEPSGLLGVGDAVAVAELEHYLAKLGGRPRVAYADRLEGDEYKQTLILFGGPDANSVTKRIVNRIDSKLRFGDPETHEVAIEDTAVHPTRRYIPSPPTRRGDGGTDYGLILRSSNPFAPEHDVLIIAGSFGYGTWGAERHVTTGEFLTQWESIRNSARKARRFSHTNRSVAQPAIECLVETDVERDTPQAIRRLLLRKLTKTV
jgi:hypothetical protein